jgi:hypothetical protein
MVNETSARALAYFATMRRVASILMVLLWMAGGLGSAAAQSSNVDTVTSDKLTKYLHKNRLPMVGAQVSKTSSGRQLMLYGYVATDFGKTDAVTKSKRYLQDSTVSVVNNIRVNPQLRHLKRGSPDQSPPDQMGDSSRMPPRADWENTFDNTLRSGGATPSNDPALNMPPPGGPAPVPPGSSW